MKPLDLTGQRFGYLEVLERGPNHGKRTTWDCLCTRCWGRAFPTTLKLMQGLRKSCGCTQHPRWQKDPRSYYERHRDRILHDQRLRFRFDEPFASKKRQRAISWAKDNPERYRQRQKRLHRGYVDGLKSPYLKSMLAQQIGVGVAAIPETLVQVQRAHLLTARAIKEHGNERNGA